MKSNTTKAFSAFLSVSLAAATPMLLFAQGGGRTDTLCSIINNAFSIVGVFGTVILIVALAILLFSAFLFITAGGDPEKVKAARSYLLYSLIGLAVAFLATFADDIVIQLFNTSGTFLNRCGITI